MKENLITLIMGLIFVVIATWLVTVVQNSKVDTEAQAVDAWILKFTECGEEYPRTMVNVATKKFVFKCK